ncbi:hypothetical protein EGJ22_23160 [Pseudomonas sp. p99-361]|nr:hypothetical protein EGJ22_23160 [Pseudomonas sp. p99-361]
MAFSCIQSIRSRFCNLISEVPSTLTNAKTLAIGDDRQGLQGRHFGNLKHTKKAEKDARLRGHLVLKRAGKGIRTGKQATEINF